MIQTGEAVAFEVPDLRPTGCHALHQGRYATSRATIPTERWTEVSEHAERHGLRATARAFGTSHGAIRQTVKRATRVR